MTVKDLGKVLFAPNCYDCETPMVLRINSHSGHLFWGCACWPECNRAYDATESDVPRKITCPNHAPPAKQKRRR